MGSGGSGGGGLRGPPPIFCDFLVSVGEFWCILISESKIGINLWGKMSAKIESFSYY